MKRNNVPTYNVYIESNKRVKGKRSIFIRIRCGNETFRILLGHQIEQKYWDNQKQKSKKSCPNSIEINCSISNKLTHLQKIWTKISNQDNWTSQMFKESCLRELNIEPDKRIQTQFWKGYNEFYNYLRDIKRRERTIQKYKTLESLLKGHEKTYGSLSYKSFDASFIQQFTSFLYAKKHTNNTVGKYVSSLKTFLGWSFEQGFHENVQFKKYKVLDEDSDIFFFSKEELRSLMLMDLSNNPDLDYARDFICFECFTGQRFSDVSNIQWSDIDFNTKTWSLWVIKTKKFNSIPLAAGAISILNKYRMNIRPFMLSNHQVNRRIKIVCDLLGFDEEIKVVRFQGSNPIENVYSKFEKIASHIGRRTFIIHSLEAGMQTEVIKSITGHTTDKAFRKYVKIVDQLKRREIDRVFSQYLMQSIEDVA